MAVSAVFEIQMQIKDIIHQIQLKLLDIFFIALPPYKLFPCFKKIIERNDIIIGMNTPIKAPPTSFADTPKAYCRL